MERVGRIGYEAYAKSTGGKTWDDRTMPEWDELPERIKVAWDAVGHAYLEDPRVVGRLSRLESDR